MKKLTVLACIAGWGVLAPAYAADIVVNNDTGAPDYVETGGWATSGSTGYAASTYRYVTGPGAAASATWTPTIPTTDLYEVYAILRTGANRPAGAPYTVTHANGSTIVTINQQGDPTNIPELYLGEFTFNAGTGGNVVLNNNGTAGTYIADAVRFRTASDDPPTIQDVSRLISVPAAAEPVPVTVVGADDRGVTSAVLNYSAAPSGNTGSLAAFDDGLHNDGLAGDGIWGATIPGFPLNETVTYYYTIGDIVGHQVSSAAQFYVVGSGGVREYRCIWVDSWNVSFLNQSQAQTLVNTCRANNINAIFAEIRKVGDAYYNSSIEPRATNITGGASYDPLQYLIDLGHDTSGGKKRIEIHAWFVMHRIAKSETLAPTHVLSQHPEYIMADSTGLTVGDGNKYLDPGHPGTVDHNVSVIIDCLSNYDIDGVNLDYIRYPEAAGSWGYNPVSIARFNAVNNRTGQPSASDPLWAAWRRECVTHEVKKIYIKMMKVRPRPVLSACTINWGSGYSSYTTSQPYTAVFQDWKAWLNEGYIDYNALMNYSTTTARFNGWTDFSLANDNKRGSIIGVGNYLHSTLAQSMTQFQYARTQGAAGMNIYDWGSEASGNSEGKTSTDFYSTLKSQLYSEWADPPVPTWKTNPTFGVLEGNITNSGVPVDHATVSIVGDPAKTTVTDGSGWWGMLEITPGSHTLQVSAPGQTTFTIPVTVNAAGDIVTANADFATSRVGNWDAYGNR